MLFSFIFFHKSLFNQNWDRKIENIWSHTSFQNKIQYTGFVLIYFCTKEAVVRLVIAKTDLGFFITYPGSFYKVYYTLSLSPSLFLTLRKQSQTILMERRPHSEYFKGLKDFDVRGVKRTIGPFMFEKAGKPCG